MAIASILVIIIGKFCRTKKLYLIILLKVDKNLEISFYYSILLLILAISLQIERDKEFLFNI